MKRGPVKFTLELELEAFFGFLHAEPVNTEGFTWEAFRIHRHTPFRVNKREGNTPLSPLFDDKLLITRL